MTVISEKIATYLAASKETPNKLASRIGGSRSFIVGLLRQDSVPPRTLVGRKLADEDPRYLKLAEAMREDPTAFCAAVRAEQEGMPWGGRRGSAPVVERSGDKAWDEATVRRDLTASVLRANDRLRVGEQASDEQVAKARSRRAAVATLARVIDPSDVGFAEFKSSIDRAYARESAVATAQHSMRHHLFTAGQQRELPEAINILIASLAPTTGDQQLSTAMSVLLLALARLEDLRPAVAEGVLDEYEARVSR